MRDWKKLSVSSTMRDYIEAHNLNAYSSEFMDRVTGAIMNNGLLFTGNETINGNAILPLTKVDVSGIVESNTIFDNFLMFFRKDNQIIELNQFPVDLLQYADGKPHFLYFKADRTYRVSDYIFGQVDEVIVARFIINPDSTWQQMYIMAQRASAPVYSTGEEFYEIDGILVKSPGGLELSYTDGFVKRSGIEFTDRYSPDVYRTWALESERVPIRYTNTLNEVDYNSDPVWNINPNLYMSYDENEKSKSDAQERIRNLFNATYDIEEFANDIADNMAHAFTITTDQKEFKNILDVFTTRMESIYLMTAELMLYLNKDYFSTIDKSKVLQNISDYQTYAETNFNVETITIDIVQKIRDSAYYIIVDTNIYDNPLEPALTTMYSDIGALPEEMGELLPVPEKKYTIQRILWDIYENCFILQYGDTLYDELEDAFGAISKVLYPVPYGRLIYIPLAVIVLEQGTTEINLNPGAVIVTKTVIYADKETGDNADYLARALAQEALDYAQGIINGTYTAAKADSLKHTDLATGTVTEYHDGDFFLNYDNLRNKLTVVNNLTSSIYDSKKALSAYQGYILNQNKLDKAGGTMTGPLNSQNILPVTNNTYDLGSSDNRWKNIYTTDLNVSGNIINSNGGQYVITGPTRKTAVRLEADEKSIADGAWSTYQNGTVVICW